MFVVIVITVIIHRSLFFILQEILLQHQKNVNEVFCKRVEQSKEEQEQYTPSDIEAINDIEFGQGRFVYDPPAALTPQEAC